MARSGLTHGTRSLPQQAAPIQTAFADRVGGVSSFGLNGTIAHAVVSGSADTLVDPSCTEALERMYHRLAFPWCGRLHVPSMYPHAKAATAERRIKQRLQLELIKGGTAREGGDLLDLDITIIGSGVSGITTASLFAGAGAKVSILEKSSAVGGVWSSQANPFSRVQSSEPAYRLAARRARVLPCHIYMAARRQNSQC